LTKKFHPDAPSGSTEKFIAIRQAFEEIEKYHEKSLTPAMREEQGKTKFWKQNPHEFAAHQEAERLKNESLERIRV